jgi:hypothetical protein
MEGDLGVAIELILLASNIKKEVRVVFDFFLSFLKKYIKKLITFFIKPYVQKKFVNIFICWMKTSCLCCWEVRYFFFVLYANEMSSTFASLGGVSKWFCWPCLDKDYSLNIFEQTTSTNGLAQKLVNKEFLIFKQH